MGTSRVGAERKGAAVLTGLHVGSNQTHLGVRRMQHQCGPLERLKRGRGIPACKFSFGSRQCCIPDRIRVPGAYVMRQACQRQHGRCQESKPPQGSCVMRGNPKAGSDGS